MSQAAAARATIAKGSKSFAAASTLLPGAVRDDVARLYAWCRHADDTIDGQDMGHGERPVAEPEARLAALREATDRALAGRPDDPVFAGLAEVVARHAIPADLVRDHLDGFAMDVAGRRYATAEDLAAYCYGVAGVVGVMLALVMGVRPADGDTLDRASDLGLAFQMTNIARDVIADASVGRIYLPTEWLAAEGVPARPEAVADPRHAAAVHRVAARLVGEAEPYYGSAKVGEARLPLRARWAIGSAHAVYRAIGVRRARAGPAGLARRVGTGGATKTALIAGALLTALRPAPTEAPRPALWTRPRHIADGAAR